MPDQKGMTIQATWAFKEPLSARGLAVLAEGSAFLRHPLSLLASPLAMAIVFLFSIWLGWNYARGHNNSAVSILVFVLGATAFASLRNMDHGETDIWNGAFLTSLLVSLVPATTAYLWTRIRGRSDEEMATDPPVNGTVVPDPTNPKATGKRKGR